MIARFLLPLASLLLACTSFAATITIVDTDKDEKLAALPNQLVSALTQAKIPFVKGQDGAYTVTVRNIRCESRSNSPVVTTDPRAFVRTTACRINTEPTLGSGKGVVLAQSITVTDRMFDANLGDCSLGGKCLAFAKLIVCSVNTKIEQSTNAGRFSCVFDDGN